MMCVFIRVIFHIEVLMYGRMQDGAPKIAKLSNKWLNMVDITILVGGLEHVLFSHILGIIIPID